MAKENKDIVVYTSSDGQVSFNVNVFNKDIWITQKQMAELFDKNRVTITEHIRNVFKDGELNQDSVCRNFRHTASDGKEYLTQYYNLDAVISVGYRVKSQRGIQFRQWATQVLKQYLLNGYAINEHRIKAIEEKIDWIVNTIKKNDSETKKEIREVYKILAKIAEKPIVIHSHSHINIGSAKLENRLIELIDELITTTKKDNQAKDTLESVKQDIKNAANDKTAKDRVISFVHDLGDSHSKTYKIIKGAGAAKQFIFRVYEAGKKFVEYFYSG